jgi:CHASE2 domain-containing sensor protein
VFVLALAPSRVGPYAAALAVGFVVGILGHVIRSRLLIVTGIVIVGAVSVYVAFVLGKVR